MNISKHIVIMFLLIISTFSAQTITPREDDIFALDKIDKNDDKFVSIEEFKEFIKSLSILEDHYSAT